MRDIEKQKQTQKSWYLRNKALTYERTKRSRQTKRDKINQIKESSPCSDCGLFFPYFVMDFDHRNSEEKDSEVSRMFRGSSWSKIMEEIKKCDLVCANCHRFRTFGARKDLIPPD